MPLDRYCLTIWTSCLHPLPYLYLPQFVSYGRFHCHLRPLHYHYYFYRLKKNNLPNWRLLPACWAGLLVFATIPACYNTIPVPLPTAVRLLFLYHPFGISHIQSLGTIWDFVLIMRLSFSVPISARCFVAAVTVYITYLLILVS